MNMGKIWAVEQNFLVSSRPFLVLVEHYKEFNSRVFSPSAKNGTFESAFHVTDISSTIHTIYVRYVIFTRYVIYREDITR